MSRSTLRWLLLAGVMAAALTMAPVDQAISRCIDCTCASACDLSCWNGFAVDTCSHYLCVDFCFPSPLTPAATGGIPGLAAEPAAACLETAPAEADSTKLDEVPGPEAGTVPEAARPARSHAPASAALLQFR